MPRHIFSSVLLVAALLSAGCMTILNGRTQQVPVITYPVPTIVRIVDAAGGLVYEGKAPAQVTLKRSESYELTAHAPGYKPVSLTTSASSTRDNIWSSCMLNVLISGGLGFFVDLMTGSMKEFDEEGIELTLLRERTAALGTDTDEDTVEVLLSAEYGADGRPYLAVAPVR